MGRLRLLGLCWAIGLIAAGCGAPGDHDPKAQLVGWWKFDEGNGTVSADASGNGNDAKLNYGGWGGGRHGGALQMDGGNDGIVTVELTESLRSTADEMTVMAWTYRVAQHNVAVVAHGYPALFFGFHGPRFKWQIQHANGRQTACYADKRYTAPIDRWIHVAATYDGWRAKLYADGVEICSRWAWGAISMPEGPFSLSGYLTESGDVVDEISGRLDDVRIYDRALSDEEIRRIALTR